MIDPTAFGMADRALMDFTGGISVLDRGPSRRWTVGNGDDGFGRSAFRRQRRAAAPSQAPTVRPRYGPRPSAAHAASRAAGPDFGVTSGFGGAAIGIDRQATPDLRLGALAGGGAGSLGVDLGSQTVDTVYGFAGAYGRYDWNGRLLDFSLTGGHRAERQRAPGGEQSGGERDRRMRTRSYCNWFVSPELGLSRKLPDCAAARPSIPAARLRYLAAWFEGYSESGSIGEPDGAKPDGAGRGRQGWR